jgi:thioredoxin-like negative regulator of GroEL
MTNKAIISVLSCLVGIIVATLILLKKDVRPSQLVQKNTIPYEVQSASAQGLVNSGKYAFANKIFENSYSHFKDNPAFIEAYTDSLLASNQIDKATQISKDSLEVYPLNKNLRIKLAKCFILNSQSGTAYETLSQYPLYSQKEPSFLSLVIMTTPNTSALDSLMGKMKNFQSYQSFFPPRLVQNSTNSDYITKALKP